VRDAYLGRDVQDSARRFAASGEWKAVRRLLRGRIEGATVVDVGAGSGIASVAFARAGAARVVAVEPDPSDEVGRGAIGRQAAPACVQVVGAFGEGIPLPDACADVVYCRQVLHHADDLVGMIAEMARVLRPGGVFIACREHVVDDRAQLNAFLAAHPVHQLAGGENAFSLDAYRAAITEAGLRVTAELGPWDSVINAFPTVRSTKALRRYARTWLASRYGRLGRVAARLGPMRWWAWRRIRQPAPGRLYTFVAERPAVA
jgi:ubiquinone/menaquinone biosynthesis C-methylase UbiE